MTSASFRIWLSSELCVTTMLNIKLLLFSAIVLSTVVSNTAAVMKIEAIYPKGFRVTIPGKFNFKLLT